MKQRQLYVVVVLFIAISMACMITSKQKHTSETRITYTAEAPTVTVVADRIRPDVQWGDLELLSRLVNAEAGSESFLGKRAVADVVVYIARHNGWSIERTIYDEGRFDGITTKAYFVEPSRGAYRAAKLALDGRHILPYGVMYFHNPETSTDSHWVNFISQYTYKRIGNHVFCYDPEYFL